MNKNITDNPTPHCHDMLSSVASSRASFKSHHIISYMSSIAGVYVNKNVIAKTYVYHNNNRRTNIYSPPYMTARRPRADIPSLGLFRTWYPAGGSRGHRVTRRRAHPVYRFSAFAALLLLLLMSPSWRCTASLHHLWRHYPWLSHPLRCS